MMKIDRLSIDKLKFADYNPRKDLKPGDPEYEKLKRSIEHFGYVEPVIVNDRTGLVVGGHQRVKVLKDLGYTEIEVVHVDLDDTNERALNVALNKISGDWDAEKLEDLLRELNVDTDLDISLTGFDTSELDTLFSGSLGELDDLEYKDEDTNKKEKDAHLEDDEFDDTDDIPKRVKSGDIWVLGDHRLICGDSLKEENYIKLLEGEQADLVFTDPPYGMNKENVGVANDNLSFDDLLEFNKVWIPLTFKYTKSNGSWYCWGIDEPLMDIYSNILKPMIKKNMLTFRNLITWNKGGAQGQLSDVHRKYAVVDEKCLFVMCGVQGFNINADGYYEGWEPIRQYLKGEADRVGLDSKKCKELTGTWNYTHWFTKAQWTFIPEEHYNKLSSSYPDAFNKDYNELRSEWNNTRAYFNNTHDNMNDIWNFNRTTKEEKESAGGHATPKPIELCARAIKSSSREGDIVLDVFGGSGSTLIACEKLGRACRMIELEPHWCDVIINRWEALTGEKAVKI